MMTIREQLLSDVDRWEGPDVAIGMQKRLDSGQAPLLAIFKARQEAHRAALMNTELLLATRFDGGKA